MDCGSELRCPTEAAFPLYTKLFHDAPGTLQWWVVVGVNFLERINKDALQMYKDTWIRGSWTWHSTCFTGCFGSMVFSNIQTLRVMITY